MPAVSNHIRRLATLAASLMLGACVAPPSGDESPQHNALAVQHAREGRHAAAIAIWQKATQGAAGPQQAYLFSNLGHAYYLAGRDDEALAALEKACLLDPLDALAWQHLAQVLARLGHDERAARMLAQARSLQEHDLRRDAALVQAAGVEAPVTLPVPVQTSGMDRVEIEQSDGMARLQRVAGTQRRPVVQALPQLQILNGNGVPGMAGALSRSLAGGPLQLLRFGNAASFRVARTRIEYRAPHAAAARQLARQIGPQVEVLAVEGQGADLRLIVGRDMAEATALHRFYRQQLQLARQALAKLG